VLDIKSLERRWLKYKLKSFAPYIGVFILLIILLIGSSVWISYKKSADIAKISPQIVAPETKITPIKISKPDENQTVLEPSMNFVQSFQNTSELVVDTIPKQSTTSLSSKPVAISIPSKPKVLSVPEYIPAPTKLPAVTKNSEKSLLINRDESKLDINSLERRFKETTNANLGLFIARYYYDQGDYNQAYNYALKTNNVNSGVEESWIIFSKSLVKLGRSDQAKKTLQLYISQSNSENARGLLDAIEKGNFK
jgi:tetratricopeptide (TPR) repeat protein